MKKFSGNLYELAAIRISTYSYPFLNRQVILLLNHLGVPDKVFEDKNDQAIKHLEVKDTLLRLSKKAARNIRQESDELLKDSNLKELIREMRLFFGPSKQFRKIFMRALLLSSNYT